MKFKVDENLAFEIAELLRDMGHEADTVTEEGLSGEPDSVVLERVREVRQILLTLDVGIADLRAYPPEQYHGIILFRLKNTGRHFLLEFVRQQMPLLLHYGLEGHLLVVSESGIRYR